MSVHLEAFACLAAPNNSINGKCSFYFVLFWNILPSQTSCTGSLRLPVCVCPVAEVYIGMSKPAEASACTQEAANLFPTSHNVLYMKGQIAELKGNTDEAKRWYEEALSINPTHVKSMQRLVMHCDRSLSLCLVTSGLQRRCFSAGTFAVCSPTAS